MRKRHTSFQNTLGQGNGQCPAESLRARDKDKYSCKTSPQALPTSRFHVACQKKPRERVLESVHILCGQALYRLCEASEAGCKCLLPFYENGLLQSELWYSSCLQLASKLKRMSLAALCWYLTLEAPPSFLLLGTAAMLIETCMGTLSQLLTKALIWQAPDSRCGPRDFRLLL